ncbi:MAG TPA: 30S ribosomal protein S13 [Thermoplasmata archaeon]|nr:30S ribosomal protein S13 [Thermoplasmata archaeon]
MAEESDDFKYIVRLANTDIDGHYSIVKGLSQVKGIGWRLATVIAKDSGLPRDRRIGDLQDEEIERIAELIERIPEIAPPWMVNRRRDYDLGRDLHLIGADLDMMRKEDIDRMKRIRCYRGIRHERGKKVRGQRTRSNGRSGVTLGVSRRRK